MSSPAHPTSPPPVPTDPGPDNDEPLVADDNPDAQDDDSTYGSLASSSTSLASSVMRFRHENGRSYHGWKPERGYILPSDEQESDRLDMQHHIFYLTLDGALHICPAGKEGAPLKRVLDAGTGTGIWAMDFADTHPGTHRALRFHLGRMLAGAFTDCPRFMQRSFDNLSPGGWLELCDITFPTLCDDGTLSPDAPLSQWNDHVIRAGHMLGHSIESAKHYRQQMLDAGFVNVQSKLYKWPINAWPKDVRYKEIGMWSEHNFCGGMYGLSVALFTRALGWSAEELEVFLVGVRKDLRNRQIHAYWPIHVVYGQKPQ